MAYIKNSVILKLNKKFMKRVRCPKCDNYITFDETKYENGQSLVFVCDVCNKQFRIRIGQSKLRATQKEEITDENENADAFGSIVVVENVFHYKQVLPLQLGDNVIGRYVKGTDINTPIETVDRPTRETADVETNRESNQEIVAPGFSAIGVLRKIVPKTINTKKLNGKK